MCRGVGEAAQQGRRDRDFHKDVRPAAEVQDRGCEGDPAVVLLGGGLVGECGRTPLRAPVVGHWHRSILCCECWLCPDGCATVRMGVATVEPVLPGEGVGGEIL